MEIIFDQNGGYEIVHSGRTLFKQVGSPDGTAWTDADRAAHAQQIFDSYFENLVKAPARQRVLDGFKNALAGISRPYPEEEKLSWDKQEAEARAFIADPTGASTPLLDAMVAATGEDKTALANKIIAKSDTYATAVGEAVGTKRKLIAQIDAATTDAEVNAAVWPGQDPQMPF